MRDSEAAYLSHGLPTCGVDISALHGSSFRAYQAYQGDKFHEDQNPLALATGIQAVVTVLSGAALIGFSLMMRKQTSVTSQRVLADAHFGWSWKGFISLGLGDNKLCTDLMASRLSQSDRNHTKTPYCSTMVVILNGCPSIFSVLAVVLCNPGVDLIRKETYDILRSYVPGMTAMEATLSIRSWAFGPNSNAESPDHRCKHPAFPAHVDKLEQGLREAKLKGKKVRGLVLIKPQNPLGDINSRDSLKEYLVLAKRYKLHVIIDEIYMLSVFDEFTKFYSVLSLKSLPVPSRTHVMWGTSKDFGISGFCFGILYTHSREAAFTVRSLGSLHVSGIIQCKLCWLLQDREWIDNVYLPTNCSRLQVAHKYITDKLNALEIRFLSCVSGLYIWFNLKKDLDTRTLEEELFLRNYFLHNKLIISCGKNYLCKEPGWFCLNSADKPDQLQLAMQRFHQVLEEWKQKRIERHLQDAQWE
ncbi:putative inactive 1-aminocyclopropane-1-carboxylate synthase-like protein 2 [Tamandua tetradactyla]|uniref:putative inactive 1-aminocyclopropane-1-carboxylate synthase-like protein 2 n=1 Tax=Tamandua tetradactyla TaxID=48850 RepID=UPI0040544BA3